MKETKCFYCGKEYKDLHLFCYEAAGSVFGKACWHICHDCEKKVNKGSEAIYSVMDERERKRDSR